MQSPDSRVTLIARDIGGVIADERPQSSPVSDDGLSQGEAMRRLRETGYNEIPEAPISPLRRFLGNFWGSIPWMIEGAALMALLLGAWGTLLIVLGNLGLNAIVAFWEEQRADRAITALRRRLSPQARVRRDGAWQTIPAREIVPGDRIHLRLGDIVPADAQLPPGASLEVDRAALTGESLPVEAAGGDIIHTGVIIRRGEADANVTATGARVHFATTIQLVQKSVPVGHLQRIIVLIGRYLLFIALALDLLILVVAAARHGDMAATLEYALLLAVAAVPVAMPTVFSVTLAVGAQRLARTGVLVSRLSAVEELAAMDQLCIDKTGTLTQNALTAGEPFSLSNTTASQVMLDAVLASHDDGQDAIDQAIFAALPESEVRSGYETLRFIPFDPARKRTEAVIRPPVGEPFQVTKGAVQVIMELAGASRRERDQVQRAIERFAAHGYRSLAVARKEAGHDWRLEGIIPLYDPLRPDARETVSEAQTLGAKVMLLTGDQHAIGGEITRAVGIAGTIVEAQRLGDTSRPLDSAQQHLVEDAAAFTQALPEHKYRIIESLQQRGHIVGMTGDGVNDTPALRKADVGIAVPGSTEAARAASDLVLVHQGLTPLVEAIRESRRIFQRLRAYTIYRVTETIRRLLALTVAVLLFNFFPVTPAMLALLATFNAAVLIALAYDETQPSARPEVWHMRQVMAVAVALSVVSLGEFAGLFALGVLVVGLPPTQLQSVMYVALTAAGYFTLLVARTHGPFWSLWPAPILLGAMVVTLVISLAFASFGWFMAPVPWLWVLLTLGYNALWFIISDLAKLAVYRFIPARLVRTAR